jgi:hypothetical protein
VQVVLEAPPNGAHRCLVVKLLVHPAARGRGIAHALMSSAEAHARVGGRSLLILDVREGDPAERLYRALGFRRTGVVPSYARSPGGLLEGATFMHKLLPAIREAKDAGRRDAKAEQSMKRSSGWVAIAGVAVELATYALASWVMGLPQAAALPRASKNRRVIARRPVQPAPAAAYEYTQPPPPPPRAEPPIAEPRVPEPPPVPQTPPSAAPPPKRYPLDENGAAPPPTPASPPAPAYAPPQRSEEGQLFEPLPWQRMRPEAAPARSHPSPAVPSPVAPVPPAAVPPSFAVQSPTAPAGPRFVAPPASDVPEYLLETAERTTQYNRAYSRAGWVMLGFYPDGSIRVVDTDGGRYEGRAENARATMRQQQGSRAFELVIGVSPEGRLQTAFHGGLHDGETLILETVAAPAGQG